VKCFELVQLYNLCVEDGVVYIATVSYQYSIVQQLYILIHTSSVRVQKQPTTKSYGWSRK
jgi:hypothetical protein